MIAPLGGCGDVINFGALNLSQLKDLGNLVDNIKGEEND
jgi:hypothetical protein